MKITKRKLSGQKLSEKQAEHLRKLHQQKRFKNINRLKQILDEDLDFYKKKNGMINISKLSRCSGFSRKYLSLKIWQLGYTL